MCEYLHPCERCPRKVACNTSGNKYKTCPDYRKFINTKWKQYRSYPVRNYRQKGTIPERKFVYEHPDLIRQYLQDGPCKKCRCADTCDNPCGAYWRWWDARMAWLRGKIQNEL